MATEGMIIWVKIKFVEVVDVNGRYIAHPGCRLIIGVVKKCVRVVNRNVRSIPGGDHGSAAGPVAETPV